MLVTDPPAGVNHRLVRRAQAVAYLAAAKLATKTGDHDLAWLAADRGQHAALAADAPELLATVRRQIACVFHDTGRLDDAERVTVSALDALNRKPGNRDHPDVLSARGALLLLAAMTSVRQGERAAARRRLAAAAEQAGVLGQDDNRLWSAFGPTNVAIHILTAALALDDPAEADAMRRAATFTAAGHGLADLHRVGARCRSLRETLACRVIFHWIRSGLPARTRRCSPTPPNRPSSSSKRSGQCERMDRPTPDRSHVCTPFPQLSRATTLRRKRSASRE